MRFDRQYLIWGLAYAVLGMALGIMMAATENHSQHVTHAHILLVGFVVSLLYGVIHKLWLAGRKRVFALVQFVTHQTGAVLMVVGLYCLYGGLMEPGPVHGLLKVSSSAVIAATIMMLVMVFVDADD